MSKRKKLIIIISSIIVLFLILFTPIPKTEKLNDGNVFSLTSLTYKIIIWDMFEESEMPYTQTDFFIFPKNFKSTKTLWNEQSVNLKNDGYGSVIMYGTITQKDETGITVNEATDSDKSEVTNVCYISKAIFEAVCSDVSYDELFIGRTLIITYDGEILESFPGEFNKIIKITTSEVSTTVIETNSNDTASDVIESDVQSSLQSETVAPSSTNSSLVKPNVSSKDTTTSSVSSQPNNSNVDLPMHESKGFWFQNVHKYPEHYDQKSKLLMPYLVIEPEDYDPDKKYPVILYFHGAGDGYPKKEDDEYEYLLRYNQRQAFQFVDGYIYCYEWLDQAIIIMPQLSNEFWWDFYPQEDGPLDAAMRIFDKVTTEFSCDSSRYYVMGPSMGGYATMEVATKYKDIFAAAMPSCAAWTCTQEEAEQLKDMPILFLHGTSDNLVYHSRSEQNYELIKSKGNTKVNIKLYDGADHDLWRYSLKDDEPFEWLFSQSRELIS